MKLRGSRNKGTIPKIPLDLAVATRDNNGSYRNFLLLPTQNPFRDADIARQHRLWKSQDLLSDRTGDFHPSSRLIDPLVERIARTLFPLGRESQVPLPVVRKCCSHPLQQLGVPGEDR